MNPCHLKLSSYRRPVKRPSGWLQRCHGEHGHQLRLSVMKGAHVAMSISQDASTKPRLTPLIKSIRVSSTLVLVVLAYKHGLAPLGVHPASGKLSDIYLCSRTGAILRIARDPKPTTVFPRSYRVRCIGMVITEALVTAVSRPLVGPNPCTTWTPSDTDPCSTHSTIPF